MRSIALVLIFLPAVVSECTGCMAGPSIAGFATYPGYTGNLVPAGEVTTSFDGNQVVFEYDLSGVDPLCVKAQAGKDNSCGIHFHKGTSCASHAEVGGHYFNNETGTMAVDPWTIPATYTSTADGKAKGKQTVVYGYGLEQTLKHTFVLHDYNGVRISCNIVNQKPAQTKPKQELTVTPSISVWTVSTYPEMTIAVGQQISFGFKQTSHDVILYKTEEAYKSCSTDFEVLMANDAANPADPNSTSLTYTWKAETSGTYYFSCSCGNKDRSLPGCQSGTDMTHCVGGQKIAVKVENGNPTTTALLVNPVAYWGAVPYPDLTVSVGDTLGFAWRNNSHDVVRFNDKAAFDACNFSDVTKFEVLAAASAASLRYTFDKAGTYMIACSITPPARGSEASVSHCSQGQKFTVTVQEEAKPVMKVAKTITLPAPLDWAKYDKMPAAMKTAVLNKVKSVSAEKLGLPSTQILLGEPSKNAANGVDVEVTATANTPAQYTELAAKVQSFTGASLPDLTSVDVPLPKLPGYGNAGERAGPGLLLLSLLLALH